MINFTELTLKNGLKVVVHEDPNSTIAALNLMYDVGSRDEEPNKTGFAHLFEHLMFGGSVNVPSYDNALQNVGSSSNAYTTTDVTNYYCTLPPNNLETGFWVESDRMFGLSFNPKVLKVQKKVVIEEFKERYLNQPYGDLWLRLCPLAYSTHPYQWPTIGKEISHIENASMQDVKDFFYKFYIPSNAVLVVSGQVKLKEVKQLCEKWFEPLPTKPKPAKTLPKEPAQKSPKTLELTSNVPLNAIFKAYHVPGRLEEGYQAVELIATILGEGNSSRLYKELVDEKRLFNNIEVYTTESVDPGLMIISGSLADEVSFEKAESSMQSILEDMQSHLVSEKDLQKAKNNFETDMVLSNVDLLHRTQELAMAALLGNTDLVNHEVEKILNVTADQIRNTASHVLNPKNSSTVHYHKGK